MNVTSTNMALWILLILILLIAGPLLTIWALNTLFPALHIPYAWDTWAAVVLLSAAIRGGVSLKRD
jgi:hypothetical protein